MPKPDTITGCGPECVADFECRGGLVCRDQRCQDRPERGREARQLGEQEQKYDLELSFPVEGDEATNIEDGQRKRIDSLIRDILLLTKVGCPAVY